MLHITKPKQTSTEVSPEKKVYQERKIIIAEYKELFSALFKLPDKEVQQRILNAINNINNTKPSKSVETQTDPVVILDETNKRHTLNVLTPDAINKIQQTNSVQAMAPSPLGSPISYTIDDAGTTTTETHQLRKRKRKRKVCLPQANKESRAALVQKSSKARMSRPQSIENGNSKKASVSMKRPRLDSLSIQLNSDSSIDCSDLLASINKEDEARKKNKMKKDFLSEYIISAYALPNGLL